MNLSDLIINHPGRNEALLYFDKNCAAATPPSKGGETYTNISIGKAICNPPHPAPPSLAPPKRLREGDGGEPQTTAIVPLLHFLLPLHFQIS